MARAGMAELITELRSMCAAGTADYTVAGVAYWTDDQLQTHLDRYRDTYTRLPLQSVVEYSGGTAQYFDYVFRGGKIERAASGTPAWDVQTTAGVSVGTANYSVNYDAGHIRFTTDQQGTAYVLSYREYDTAAAAAAVWDEKAAAVAGRFDVATDTTTLSRSQLIKHCQQMASLYRRRRKARATTLQRGDLWGG